MTETDIAKLPDLAGFEKIKDWFIEREKLIEIILCKGSSSAGRCPVPIEWNIARLNPPARLVIFGASGTGKTRALAAGDEVFSDSERLYEVDSTLCHKISYKDVTLAEKGCKAGRSAFDLFFRHCDKYCEHHELCKTEENYCLYLGHGTRPVLFIIDDLQEFQSKAHLEFLKEAFDEESLSICAAVQIPEALPEGGLKPWLIEQLGQGRHQSLAEAVVRRLLEPENEFVILEKGSTPGTTGSNRENDTPAGKKGRGTV